MLINTTKHLKVRIKRMADTWIDTWPKWNNMDFVSVSELISENEQLRKAVDKAYEWSAAFPLSTTSTKADKLAANDVYDICRTALGE